MAITSFPISPSVNPSPRPSENMVVCGATSWKKSRSILYNKLIVTGKLYAYLRETDAAAQARLETIMPRLMQDAGITETLKAQNQMEWVQRMNAIKAQVEEIINDELIYVWE